MLEKHRPQTKLSILGSLGLSVSRGGGAERHMGYNNNNVVSDDSLVQGLVLPGGEGAPNFTYSRRSVGKRAAY